MKITRAMLLSALVVTAVNSVVTIVAQSNDAQSTSYQSWTKEETEKLLNDSPWAQTRARSGPVVSFGVSPIVGPTSVYTVRLRSALPIRFGMLRMRQILEKYREMNDSKKAAFDESNRPLIECPACVNNYVVSIVPPTGTDPRKTLPAGLSRGTVEKLKLYVQLINDRGEQRDLVHIVPSKSPGQEVLFFFPRLDDKGEPLLTASSKKLIFKIDASVLDGDVTLSRFEFDVTKMIVNQKVIF